MALPTAASPDCVALIITWDRLGTETFAGKPCVGGEPLTGDGKTLRAACGPPSTISFALPRFSGRAADN